MRQCPDRYAIRAGQNLPDKEFRYLRTVIVTAAVHWGFDSMLAHLLLTFQHRAGVSSYTSSFDLAQTCVFGKQLLGPILCGSISGAPLLPKLRGQFAEFLNNPSPVGLRILSSSTCVGLRYGRLSYPSHLFSLYLSCASLLFFSPFRPSLPTLGSQSGYMSVCLNLDGYGISTVCASTTPFGLALAPGLPVADEPSHGNLRFSAITILTQFSLLIPAFSLV